MTTKLYTAAEARRIDIERGGYGFIINQSSSRVFYYDEKCLTWRLKDSDCTENGLAITRNVWLPLAEAPEHVRLPVKNYSEILEQRNTAVDKLEQLEKELAEYKNNYHEILADHGELTQKFDELKDLTDDLGDERNKACQELRELKEKQRRKSCKDEKPTTNQKIIFLDGNSMLQRGQYIPLHSQWYLHVGEDHYIALASSTVENWTWKYEADL